MYKNKVAILLKERAERYNCGDFIESDPISIPHQFQKLQDIEIIGFWVAMLAWGQRKTIINKAKELVQLMDGKPYEFIINHKEADRARFLNFKHRTFNSTDTLYFLDFFQRYYNNNNSLEQAFSRHLRSKDLTIEGALNGFHKDFFDHEFAPQRTRKHVSLPDRKSTCKRLNMFLRWMVRNDNNGVDFGLWESIKMAQLCIPLDVHVERVARLLNLITRKQRDWKTVIELTDNLRKIDPLDPVKFDFALFGISAFEDGGASLLL